MMMGMGARMGFGPEFSDGFKGRTHRFAPTEILACKSLVSLPVFKGLICIREEIQQEVLQSERVGFAFLFAEMA